MGDYVGVRHGYVTGGIKQRFGVGADKKNYLVTDGDVVLIVNDTKKAVQAKLGLPDVMSKNIDGYDCWEYRERKLKLYFNEDSLRSWEVL
ncbi:MAG: hypothetical protein ABH865_08495 [Candidatus Omnitrophota bacterium]|nr:hypothetical protein [Candidatus Omnitrophota bacterium]